MKKKYRWLKVKLISIFIVIYLIANGLILGFEADKVCKEYYQDIAKSTDSMAELKYYYMYDEDLILQMYDALEGVRRFPDIGFYCVLKDKEGNIYAEDQNFIIVEKPYETEDGEKYDRRVLLLGDEFVSNDEYVNTSFQISAFSQLEIIGKCDDTYIYLDELKWIDDSSQTSTEMITNSYIPKNKQEVSGKELVNFEDWSGSRFYGQDASEHKYFLGINSVCPVYSDWDKAKKLNSEAEYICNQAYEDYINETTRDSYDDGSIFTEYIAGAVYLDDTYVLAYAHVFHPYSIAFYNLSSFFFISFCVGWTIIWMIYYMIDKMYKQHEAYETNRQSLTRGIAHELKTPLSIAKGYVENWEYIDDKDRPEAACIMIEEIDHMNKMVMDLLELSHLEAKVKKVNLETVDIHQLTTSVLKRMEPLIKERKLEVVVEAGKESAEDKEFLVEADLGMMRTVLENFVSNAIKYAYKKINICISEKGKKVRFEIANHGNEISYENAKNIWNEFYRTENAEKSRTEGTGLGLAITKNILELHNAKYGYKRIKGENIFWFEMKIHNN